MEIIHPKTKEEWLALRTKDVTSTDASALFGMSPYKSLFQLFHEKRSGVVTVIEENERMKWGTRMQDTIAAGIAEDEGWNVTRIDEYSRRPEWRIGSSFDFEIDGGPGGENSLLEIKNVGIDAFSKGWIVDGDSIEAPLHIEIQVQHQMLVSGIPTCYIGAFVGGNDVRLIKRVADKEIHQAILTKAEEFWRRVDANDPPPIDWTVDAKFVQSLYSKAREGTLDAREDKDIAALIEEYKHASSNEKMWTTCKDAVKAKILMRIGEVSKVEGNDWSITCGMSKASVIEAHTRDPYRMFRVNFKKGNVK